MDADGSQLPPPGLRLIITFCVMLASIMQTLDSTIANVALPFMQGSLSASQEEINWVLTSYLVAAAIMTAPTGFLAGRFGTKNLFLASISGFTLASALCGMAQSLEQIVLFRALQGIFGAALVPLSQSVMFEIFPPEQRGTAISFWGMGTMVGPVMGPILGGWLTEHYSWRWVFYVNVPFGILSLVGLMIFFHASQPRRTMRLDWLGFAALSLAVGAFQMVLDRGETQDWFSSREIIAEACLAGLGLYIFLVQLFLAAKPFLSPAIFKDVNFLVANILIFTNGATLYATLALLAPYLQHLMNYPALDAGIILAPRGVGVMIAGLFVARLMPRIGPRPIVGFGLVAGVYTIYQITTWTPDIAGEIVFITGLMQGIATGCQAIPLNLTGLSTLPAELRTEAAGVMSLLRNLGSAVGISITGALLVSNTQVNHSILAAGITPFDRLLQSGAPAQFWNPHSLRGALSLDDAISRQASIIAYTDDFQLLLLLTILSLPLVLLLRPISAPRARAEIAAD